MTYKSVALNSFTPVSTPTIVNNVEIDGYVDGRPVVLRKGRDGMLIPARGTVVPLSMGTGIVTGYTDDMLIVDVVEFNDDFMYITASESDIYDAEEYVAMLNRCYRRGIECKHETFTRLYKSDVTDVLSDKNMERMLQAYPMPEPTEIIIGFKGNYLKATDHIVVREITVDRESPKERRARLKAERALAKRLADAMLEDADVTDVPDDVQADIQAEFADMDF